MLRVRVRNPQKYGIHLHDCQLNSEESMGSSYGEQHEHVAVGRADAVFHLGACLRFVGISFDPVAAKSPG
jgi:hypothetical protein